MYKMVIVVRKDLKMRRGKEIAQAGHGVILAYLSSRKDKIDNWFELGNQAKITVSCPDEYTLLDLARICKETDINHSLVLDSGKTEFHNKPTYTVLAVGPDKNEIIDEITGHLTLY